jgi:hypothetical protein
MGEDSQEFWWQAVRYQCNATQLATKILWLVPAQHCCHCKAVWQIQQTFDKAFTHLGQSMNYEV